VNQTNQHSNKWSTEQAGGGQGQDLMRSMDTIPTLNFGKIKGSLLVVLLLFPLNVYGFDKLDKTEIALEAAWLTLHTVDYGQTLSIAKNPGRYYEKNLILGRHPSEDEVHGYMIGTALLHPVITYLLPRKVDVLGVSVPVRFMWQSVSIGVSGTCVVSNANIGLRIGF
jgi:hypothetical protein